jgi:predicted ribosomally synthesized peptide with SipW-like signal peptide
MKRILLSVLTIGLVGTGLVGATRAYFSDTEKSQGNTFTAGAIDLQVDYKSTYNGEASIGWSLKDLGVNDRFFDHGDLKPGDYGEGTISLHVFSNNAYLWGQIIPKFNDDYSSNEPELEAGDAQENSSDAWDGELAQNLYWEIWKDDGETAGLQCLNDEPACTADPGEGDNVHQTREEYIAQGYASELGTQPTGWIYLGEMESNKTYYIGTAWNIDLGVGNIIQTDRYQADIAFLATQQRHITPGALPTPIPTP